MAGEGGIVVSQLFQSRKKQTWLTAQEKESMLGASLDSYDETGKQAMSYRLNNERTPSWKPRLSFQRSDYCAGLSPASRGSSCAKQGMPGGIATIFADGLRQSAVNPATLQGHLVSGAAAAPGGLAVLAGGGQ